MQCDCNLGNCAFVPRKHHFHIEYVCMYHYINIRNNPTVWLGDWLRRWLRESFESHSALIPEVHAMYEVISETTCLDSRYSANTKIPLVRLYPDHICHASALSAANSLKYFNFLTFFLIIQLLIVS